MPELPEVETIRRGLNQFILKAKITKIDVLCDKSFIGTPVTGTITGIRRVSKPGLRIYTNVEDMPKVMKGLGIAILSTSKGIMTDKEARKANVGGEVLAFVW